MQTPGAPMTVDDPQDDIAAQATLWVVRLTSGETTAEERAEFRRWRDADPAHAEALAQARRLWLALGPALEMSERRRASAWRSARAVRIGALAASLAACLVGGAAYLDTRGHDYVTGAGERRTVVLADGVKVLMSSRSALDVSYSNGVRKVTLARGQAYFDVVHDPARPFEVAAGDGVVRDIGTAFSVRRKGDGASVVVARGEVEVDPAAPGARPATLTGNQATAYGAAGPTTVRAVDAAEALSWVKGSLVLENRSLADSVAEINRYYGGRIVVTDPAAGARRINAVVDLDRIDDWLAALDKTQAVRTVRVGSLVLLY